MLKFVTHDIPVPESEKGLSESRKEEISRRVSKCIKNFEKREKREKKHRLDVYKDVLENATRKRY